MSNENTYDRNKGLPLYSPRKKGKDDIIKGIELLNKLSGLDHFLNIGYADSFFEYWLLKPGISSKRLTEELIRPISNIIGENILVIGAGKGGELTLLNELTGAKIIGVEPSEYNIMHAKELVKKENKGKDIKILKGIAERLPFPDQFFSCVYSCEAAFHFEDKKAFIEEAHRVLKNSGVFIIGDITKKDNLVQNKIVDDYKAMLNTEKFFTKDDYLGVIEETFRKRPEIDEITDKNIKHLAKGSELLIKILEFIENFPLLKIKIDRRLNTRNLNLSTFLENIRTTKLSYKKSVIEYLRIICVK